MSKKFEVGDEVETTQRVGDFYEAGARGTVKEIDGDDIWVRFHAGKYKLPFGDHGGWHTFAQWLRHVPPAQPAAPAVTSRAVVLAVEGVEYTAMFAFNGDITTCLMFTGQLDKRQGIYWGVAKRNPRDTYSEAVGMRVTMKRACGIGQPHAHQLPAVYSAFRKWQHDQAAPQPKQAKPLVVGAEVRAVKDSHDAPFFCKGASGVVIKVETVDDDDDQPYLVRWTSGPVKEGCGRGAETPKTWWAYADEIEAV